MQGVAFIPLLLGSNCREIYVFKIVCSFLNAFASILSEQHLCAKDHVICPFFQHGSTRFTSFLGVSVIVHLIHSYLRVHHGK